MLKLMFTASLALSIGGAAGYLAGKEQTSTLEKAHASHAQSLRLLTTQISELKTTCTKIPQVVVSGTNANTVSPSAEQRPATQPSPTAPQTTSAADPGTEPAQDNPEKLFEGHELIAGAVRAGRWTDAHAQQLHALADDLNETEYTSLLQELAVNVNKGRLQPEALPF